MICRILDTSISSFLLDRNILSHPWHLHFFVSTRPEYSIASSTIPFLRIFSTRIIYRIIDRFISLDLLDQNILSDPRHLHFFVPSRPEHSIAALKTQFPCIYSTERFHCILDTSCSSYLLDQNILPHPLQIHFLRIYSTRIFKGASLTPPTRPKYSFASVTPPFLRIKCTKIFFCILTATQGVLFVSTKMMVKKENRAYEQLKHLDYHASFYCLYAVQWGGVIGTLTLPLVESFAMVA